MKKVFALVTLAFVAACGSDSPTGPRADITGTYTLRSVNGVNVPAVVVQVPDYSYSITGGRIVLNADLTCSAQLSWSETESGTTTTGTESDTCTYRQNGDALTFRWSDSSEDSASLISGTISLTTEGTVLIFRK